MNSVETSYLWLYSFLKTLINNFDVDINIITMYKLPV